MFKNDSLSFKYREVFTIVLEFFNISLKTRFSLISKIINSNIFRKCFFVSSLNLKTAFLCYNKTNFFNKF